MIKRKITAFKENIKGMNKRNAFAKIKSFIEGNECYKGKILAIYGLRGTGKKTLMEQTVCETDICAENCVYFEVQDKDTMADLEKRIIEEQKKGKSIIVLDEITRASDFIGSSSVLADCFAKEGLRIIISGSDSLCISFAEEGELYDRTDKVNTTYISFAEYCRVFQTSNMDDYIEYGGIISKSGAEKTITDYESILKYIDSAVSSNIANSLKKNTDLDERDSLLIGLSFPDLKSIVQKAAELYSGIINKSICEEIKTAMLNHTDYKLSDISDIELFDTLAVNKETARQLAEIINAEQKISVFVTSQMIEELERWLKTLGFLSVTEEKVFEKTTGGWKATKPVYRYCIVQPTIKYNYLKKAIEYAKENEKYYCLNERQQEEYMKLLDEKVKEDMTKQIVVFDVMNSLPQSRYMVCKPVFRINNDTVGEYDMLIYDKYENRYWAFEIKRTSKPFNECTGQEKALIKAEMQETLDKHFGRRENACVLYNGKHITAPTGIEYYNISDFLIAVDECRDMDKAMELLRQMPGKNDNFPLGNFLV